MAVKDGDYDWNGRPIKVQGGKVLDYVGNGQWVPSSLGMSNISRPGGDLSQWHDDAQMKRAMARVDKELKGE